MVDFSELVDWVVLDKFFVSHEAVDIVVYRVCAVHELALYSHLAEVAGFEFFRGRNLIIAFFFWGLVVTLLVWRCSWAARCHVLRGGLELSS